VRERKSGIMGTFLLNPQSGYAGTRKHRPSRTMSGKCCVKFNGYVVLSSYETTQWTGLMR